MRSSGSLSIPEVQELSTIQSVKGRHRRAFPFCVLSVFRLRNGPRPGFSKILTASVSENDIRKTKAKIHIRLSKMQRISGTKSEVFRSLVPSRELGVNSAIIRTYWKTLFVKGFSSTSVENEFTAACDTGGHRVNLRSKNGKIRRWAPSIASFCCRSSKPSWT